MGKDYKALKLEQIELLNIQKTNAKLKLRDKFKDMDWFFSFNNELPKNWIDVNILDVTWLVTCGVAKKPNYIEKGIPFLSAQNARPFKANLNKIKYISQEQFETLTVGGKPVKNDILYTRVGNCGEAAKVPFDFDFAVYVSLTLIKPIHQIIDSDFLVAFLNSYYGLTQANIGAIGSGLKNLNVNNVRRFRIPLPPLAEQQRIVAKLDELFGNLDTLKTRLNNIPQILKNFRQAVLTQAVTGKLTAEWRKGKELETSTLLLDKIRIFRKDKYICGCKLAMLEAKRKPKKPLLTIKSESELIIDLPKTWLKCFVGDIGEVCNGSTPSRKVEEYWAGNIPWVSSGLVQNGRINQTDEYITQLGFENSSVRLLPMGSVLIAMIGEGKTRGQSAILDIDATTNQNIAGVIIDHGFVKSEYLFYWFKYRYEANRLAGSGTGPKALNGQKVRELDFVLAPIEEQTVIVRRVEALFTKADAIETAYQNLKQQIDALPQAILAKAFKGELVAQLPTDGDAKELLKEIAALRASVEKVKRSKKLKPKK